MKQAGLINLLLGHLLELTKKKYLLFWDCEQRGKFDISFPVDIWSLLEVNLLEREDKWRGTELKKEKGFVLNP